MASLLEKFNNSTIKSDSEEQNEFKNIFNHTLNEFYAKQQGNMKKAWMKDKILEVIKLIKKFKVCNVQRTSADYYWYSKYDVITIADEDYLIFKKKSPDDSTVVIIPTEQYFDILVEIHESCEHGGRDKMLQIIKNKYYIQKKAVEIYLSLCPACKSKRNSFLHRKNIVNRTETVRRYKTEKDGNDTTEIDSNEGDIDTIELPTEEVTVQTPVPRHVSVDVKKRKIDEPEPKSEDETDDCTIYGQLLASKLRNISKRARLIVMNQIDNLIFQTQMNEMDESPSEAHLSPEASYIKNVNK